MGKNKQAKPPSAAKKGSAAPFISPAAVVGALAVVGLACVAYDMSKGEKAVPTSRQPSPSPAPARSKKPREMTAHELRQQGRQVPGSERPRCVDGRGCAGVTADQCADEAVASKCCVSCFKATCVDKDPSCIPKAQKGACYLEPEYMNATCCFACSPDPEDRCSPDPRKRPEVAEGDLTKVFERAINEYPQYGPRVLSRDPWVVAFDNIMTDEEADGVYEAVGGKNGEYLKPSTTAQVVNGVLTDVPDTIRTSWNAWCQHEFCYNHPIHERVITRIMDVVGLPHDHAEHMQLLKYGPGEYYRLHHDWIPQQEQALCMLARTRTLLQSYCSLPLPPSRLSRPPLDSLPRQAARASSPSSSTSPMWRRGAARASPTSRTRTASRSSCSPERVPRSGGRMAWSTTSGSRTIVPITRRCPSSRDSSAPPTSGSTAQISRGRWRPAATAARSCDRESGARPTARGNTRRVAGSRGAGGVLQFFAGGAAGLIPMILSNKYVPWRSFTVHRTRAVF